MSSEQIANGINPLDSNLGGAWDVLKGYSGRDTDLGIARRFGGAVAAYSLRDIGAMNGAVIRVRRDTGGGAGDDDEEDFSANQVASGALEDFVGSGNDGFVTKWYDQSGNHRPMIQASTSEQPIIVENGVFLGGVKADAATSNDTMQNLQVSTDGTTANFGTNSWANGGTKLGLIYVGKVLDGTTTSNPAPFWGGGRGVSQFQAGGVSLQVIKGGNDSFRLVNERQDLTPASMTTSLTLNSDDDIIVTGTTDNRDFTLTVNASSASDTEAADLDVRETSPISLFGSYDKNAGRYYQRSSAGICKECYLYSGDNISEVATIATEINKHYNIY